MSVDLPAPFSPIRPTTSWGRISIETDFSACTPGKRLSTWRSAKAGGSTSAGALI